MCVGIDREIAAGRAVQTKRFPTEAAKRQGVDAMMGGGASHGERRTGSMTTSSAGPGRKGPDQLESASQAPLVSGYQ